MKKIKNLEIPKNKYIYQRNNGTITKYIVDEDYYISVETGIATKKDETIFLGKISENIIDLIEVGDYVNGLYIDLLEKDKIWATSMYSDEDIVFYENEIKTILTHEQYQENCYTVERKSKE